MSVRIPTFGQVNILVIGDVILDRYWHGTSSRISPEAPVPVVDINQSEDKPGGAGNVALNLKTLGCHVALSGFLGQDSYGDLLQSKLETSGIECLFQKIEHYQTISKLRVLGQHQQLIRLDFEKSSSFLKPYHLAASIQPALSNAQAIVLSDYAKGCLHHVQDYIQLANTLNIPTFVDPKSNDFSIYRGATVITPNLKEFEAVVGRCANQEDIISKGHRLLEEYNLMALLVTQSENGMTLLEKNKQPLHLATRAREVFDVTGAGDTVISILAAAFAAGESLADAAQLANIAAGIVIQKMGATQVSIPELRRAMQRHQNSGFGVLTEDELMIAIEDAKAHHETIVMTNGCFDILHSGHIQYLEAARKLGHRLLIAVNDDASVQRLKGMHRPINAVDDRMTLLSALRAVDWVVPFAEDTPARLISKIAPDILVKGGDYQVHEIAGADFVQKNGGKVIILPFKNGYSTTKILERATSCDPVSI